MPARPGPSLPGGGGPVGVPGTGEPDLVGVVAGLSWDVVRCSAPCACVGAFVQSVVGLGLGLLVAPVVALVAPSLVPALPLWLALMISGSMLLGERRHVDWRALAWALPARVPGTVVGAWLVVHVQRRRRSRWRSA